MDYKYIGILFNYNGKFRKKSTPMCTVSNKSCLLHYWEK